MNIPSDVLDTLEAQLLKVLIAKLEEASLSVEDAQERAKAFLALLPFASLQDADIKLKQYSKTYPEFAPVELMLLQYEDKQATTEQLMQLRQRLQSLQVEPLHLAQAHAQSSGNA